MQNNLKSQKKQQKNYLRKTESYSLSMISIIPFCMGMSVAISIESVSARITVGPNTMATLVANILFTEPISTTLQGGKKRGRDKMGRGRVERMEVIGEGEGKEESKGG